MSADHKEEQEKEEKTIRQEVLDICKNLFFKIIDWLKPNPKDALTLTILKSILKLPVLLIIICLSPIALTLMVIIFVILL